MALTDRTNNLLLNQARVASNVDIAAPATLVAQLDQRHITLSATTAGTLTAQATYRFYGFVADRAYKVISARFIPPFLLTASVTNYATINVNVNADTTVNETVLATYSNINSNLTANQSIALTVQSANVIASGQRVDLVFGYGGTGQAFNATVVSGSTYVVDLVVQEV